MKATKVFVVVATILASGLCLTSCVSSSSKPTKCPICGKALDSSNSVECTTVTGQHITVCGACYTVGRQAGKCM